jgi:hypothetical protein
VKVASVAAAISWPRRGETFSRGRAVPKETRQENTKLEQDRQLDRELEDTFPASDPPNITRVPYERRFTSEAPSNDDRAEESSLAAHFERARNMSAPPR